MRVARALLVPVLLLVAGCDPPRRNQELAPADLRADYGYRDRERPGQVLPDHHVVLTFSGGGTRAAALAQGVLRELAATPIRDGRTMLDEIDQISSVSGGSVTAANVVANGRDSFDAFERDFLRHDGMSELFWGVLSPLNWPRLWTTAYSRIDLHIAMLDRLVFHGKTFADLPHDPDSPFLILNAADMTSGMRFTFTQSQFDLICSDLSRLPVAVAVAASSAFPVGMTPVTLVNHAPCPAQAEHPRMIARVGLDQAEPEYADPASGRDRSDTVWVDPEGAEYPRRSRGLRESGLLNTDGRKRFVHLLDGGIADNLGLGEPLELIYARGQDGTPPRAADLDFIVVNARAEGDTDRDTSGAPPGILAMLATSIDASIDGRSGGLEAQLATLPILARALGSSRRVTTTYLAFELIRDAACRDAFQNLATAWTLEDHQIDALLELGSAMLRAQPTYRALVEQAGGTVGPDTLGSTAAPGQDRAAEACRRLLYPNAQRPPVRYGSGS